MHISQFKFVSEVWLKEKNGIILWKIKLDLVSEPSIWYTVCLQYAEQTLDLHASTILFS